MTEFVRDRQFPIGQHRHFTIPDPTGSGESIRICDCNCPQCMLRLMGECVCPTWCDCTSQNDHELLTTKYLDAPAQPARHD